MTKICFANMWFEMRFLDQLLTWTTFAINWPQAFVLTFKATLEYYPSGTDDDILWSNLLSFLRIGVFRGCTNTNFLRMFLLLKQSILLISKLQ